MPNSFKTYALATLVFFVVSPVGLAAKTLKTQPIYNEQANNTTVPADKLFQEGLQQYRRGEYLKALSTYQRVLEIRRQQGDKAGIAQTLNNMGEVYYWLQDGKKAKEVLQQALAIRKELKDLSGEAETLNNLGLAHILLLEFDKGFPTLQEALNIYYALKDKRGRSITLSNLGAAAGASALRGKLELPAFKKSYSIFLKDLQKALAIQQEIGDKFLVNITLIRIAEVYQLLEDYPRALESSNQAIAMSRDLKNKALEAYSLLAVKDVYVAQKQQERALTVFQQALSLAQETGIRRLESNILLSLGSIYSSQKKYDLANAMYEKSQIIATELKDKLNLFLLLLAYEPLRKHSKQIEISQQLLMIAKEAKDYESELLYLSIIVQTYNLSDNNRKVIEYAIPLLELARTIKKPESEAFALVALGSAYNSLAVSEADYQKAIGVTQQGLEIARQIKKRNIEISALNTLGSIYSSLSEFEKAIEFTQASLKLAQDAKDLPTQADAFSTMGKIYLDLGNYQKADEYMKKAIAILETEIKRNNLTDLTEIVDLLKSTKLFVNTIKFYTEGDFINTVASAQEGLTFAEKISNSQQAVKLKAGNLIFLGLGYGGLKNYPKANDTFQKALLVAKQSQNPTLKSGILFLNASIYRQSGQKDKAISTYNEVLAISQDAKLPGSPSTYAQVGLARTYRDLNKPATAITYYKQAINDIEQIRQKNRKLSKDLQDSILQSFADIDRTKTSDIYRELANLLISQGRVSEAQQVLERLKIQELKDNDVTATTKITPPPIQLNEGEQKINQYGNSVIALATQVSECEKTNCQQKSQLQEKLTAVVNEFNKDLDKIENEINSRLANDKGAFRPDSPKAKEIVKSQPGTVMIYPLVLEDKIWLLLYSGDAGKKFEVKVSRQELGNTVKEFRSLMEECEKRTCGSQDIAKIQPVSQKLYNWLIKPLEGEIKQNKVRNLVFALDRVTRYIPMSALFDGKQYLIENYTVYNVLSADLTDTTATLPKGTQNTSILAMGVSQAIGGFGSLPNVPKELNLIVKTSTNNQGIYPGKEYLNKAFDYRTLQDNLTGKNILHLATHGEFVPGSKDASYLLLGSGDKLAIPQIRNLTGLSNIHLVVLSACQTALAAPLQDGTEIASVAYYFLNSGTKSVMASLWQVADESTSLMMQSFYKNMAVDAKPTKAEALRLAQLSLLSGKEVTIDDIKRGLSVTYTPGANQKTTTRANFAHPYYWAPFILIGNGL